MKKPAKTKRTYTRRKPTMTTDAPTPSPAQAPQVAEATPRPLRRKRASVGGYVTRLDAPKRPGYVRRYVLNDPARIIEMQNLGYDFAQDRAGDGETRTDGQGTRISRHAGKDEVGRPTQLVLMETPVEEYAVGVAEKEDRLKPFEEAIRRGDDPTGGLTKAESYDPGGVRSTINNKVA